MVAETVESLTQESLISEEYARALAATGIAEVVQLQAERPGMAATLAFYNWSKRQAEQYGYGFVGFAEYKHDDDGRLYIDPHGSRVYLSD